MEVKIGVQNASRELTLDVAQSAEEIEEAVAKAIADDSVLALSDAKGRRLVVPATKLAYVEIATSATGTVGFRS